MSSTCFAAGSPCADRVFGRVVAFRSASFLTDTRWRLFLSLALKAVGLWSRVQPACKGRVGCEDVSVFVTLVSNFSSLFS